MRKLMILLLVAGFLGIGLESTAEKKAAGFNSHPRGRHLKLKKDRHGRDYNAEEIVIRLKDKASDARLEEILKKHNLRIKKRNSKDKFVVVESNDANAPAADKLNELMQQADEFGNAEQIFIDKTTAISPADYMYQVQWNLYRIGIDRAQTYATGSNVVVAVIDSGVKQSHVGLAGVRFSPGYDFVNNTTAAPDDNGHGTHICGTIALSTTNKAGIKGIAYGCTIMPVKVMDADGNGNHTDIAEGIYWAVDHGAHIINMSFGGPNSVIKEEAVKYAVDHNVLVISSAGNSGDETQFYPAAYPGAISVSATDINDRLAAYSTYGSTVDICAPGGSTADYNGDRFWDAIVSCGFAPNTYADNYCYRYGTSSAAAHVSGVAALIKSRNPNLSAAAIKYILQTTADDLGVAGWDKYFGYGLINAENALIKASDPGFSYQEPSITNSSAVVLNADFKGASGFTYRDDAFDNTHMPNYASGYHMLNGGYSGHGLQVYLGDYYYGGKSSGAFSKTFSLDKSAPVTISLRYRSILGYDYNTYDYGQAVIMLDGAKIGNAANNSLSYIQGSGSGYGQDLGWKQFSKTLSLGSGQHTLTIGAINNDYGYGYAWTMLIFDDVRVSTDGSTSQTAGSSSAISYCNGWGASSPYIWIAKFSVGDFYNSSGSGYYGYSNFTDKTLDMAIGKTYNITLKPGFYYYQYYVYYKIWIDFNCDGDFTDSNELLYTYYGYTTLYEKITIPANIKGATTRLRVAIIYGNGSEGPCSSFSDGEIEDYTINLLSIDNGGGGSSPVLVFPTQ